MSDLPRRGKSRLDALVGFVIIGVALGGVSLYVGYVQPILNSFKTGIEESSKAGENISWSIYQMQTEISELKITVLQEALEKPFFSEIGVRYEIALGRSMIIREGIIAQQINEAMEGRDPFKNIAERLIALEPTVKRAETGDAEALQTLLSRINGIHVDCAKVALEANRLHHFSQKEIRQETIAQVEEARIALTITTVSLAGTILLLFGLQRFTARARREAEYQREKAIKHARSKSRFLASMSHEIRTPLNAILGFSKVAAQSADSTPPQKLKEYMSDVNSAGQQLMTLIDGILDWSKIESDKLALDMFAAPIRENIEEFHRVYARNAEAQGIQLSLKIDADFPSFARIDPIRLTQIMTNLVGNALKFTESGKRIEIHCSLEQSMLTIRIRDEGIGIHPSKLSNIFNVFEQAESSTTRKFGGTGLGLSISRELTRLMKGDIDVDSEEGVGSTFTVTIPYLGVSEEEIATLTAAAQPDRMLSLASDNIVLLVEDGPLNRKLISVIFENLGIRIHTANNGKEGVEAALRLRPDLILMDMQMPEMDGLEATRIIRSSPEISDTPIVFLSANAFAEDRDKAIEAGVNTFLTKPLRLEDLKTQLVKYLKAPRIEAASI